MELMKFKDSANNNSQTSRFTYFGALEAYSYCFLGLDVSPVILCLRL